MVDVFMMSMITERRHCIFVSLLIVILIQMLGTDCDTDVSERLRVAGQVIRNGYLDMRS